MEFNEIEEDVLRTSILYEEIEVKRLQDLPQIINFPIGQGFLKYGTLIMISILNLFVTVSNIIILSKLLEHGSKNNLGLSQNIIKFFSFLVFLGILLIIVEPEKMKFMSPIAFVIVTLVGKFRMY